MRGYEPVHGEFIASRVSPSSTAEHLHEALVELVAEQGEVVYLSYVWNRLSRRQPFPKIGDKVKV